jgi:hypothetical protein
MRRKIVIFLAIILGIALILWVLFLQKRKSLTTSTKDSTTVQTVPSQKTQLLTSGSQQVQTNLIANNVRNDELKEYFQKLKQDPTYEWKLPINFFGRVLDESNEPIAGADIHFGWNSITANGVASDETLDSKSSELGLFELRDKKGDPLSVSVSKQGYYPKTEYFWYNPDRGPFRPDQNNPFVFHLHKKGPGVNLITSQNGMSPDLHAPIPRDGTPTKVDLMHQTVGATGQMILSEIKPEYKYWQQATQWSFNVEIPDGGFIGENDEYPYEAPTGGYQSIIEFDFQKSSADWKTGINTNLYIEFGNPPLYGRLQIKTGIYSGGATLTYAINPNGSRDLEPAQQ